MHILHHISWLMPAVFVFSCATPQVPTGTFPTEEATFLNTWCDRGVQTMCIDVHYQTLKEDPTHQKSLMYLEAYCAQGYGSACLYASRIEGDDVHRRACALKEARACEHEARDWLMDPARTSCTAFKNPYLPGWTTPEAYKDAPRTLKKEDIRRVVKTGEPAIRYCYERKLAGLSKELTTMMAGQVLTSTLIRDHHGLPHKSLSMCSDFHDEEIARCTTQVMKSLVFEDEQGRPVQWRTRIYYPFIFLFP